MQARSVDDTQHCHLHKACIYILTATPRPVQMRKNFAAFFAWIVHTLHVYSAEYDMAMLVVMQTKIACTQSVEFTHALMLATPQIFSSPNNTSYLFDFLYFCCFLFQ